MDFLAFLERPGGDAAARRRTQSMAAEAARLRLEALEHEKAPLPIWVSRPADWKTTLDAGGSIIASARTVPDGLSTFERMALAGETAPIFQVARPGTDTGGRVACDQVGIATVYYRDFPDGVAFASRSSWLLPRNERKLNLLAAYHFLNFMVVPTPFSIYQGVARLPPGMMAAVRRDTELKTYWDLVYDPDPSSSSNGRGELLLESIRQAVRKKASRNDPAATAAFLSGGTDSTTVAALAAETLQSPLDTVSIVFQEERFSEERFIRAAAERFPLRVNIFQLDANALLQAIDPIQEAYDEPYANPSVFAGYYCFSLASKMGKRVLLAGDGGDEIFGGNERYLKDKLFGAYRSLPAWLRKSWELPIRSSTSARRTINRARNFIRRANLENPDRFYSDDEFASAYWDRLLGPAFLEAGFPANASAELLRSVYTACKAPEELNRLLYLDMKGAIADNDLRKIARAGTIFDIEPQFPLLDVSLVDFANRVPARLKVRGLQKRYLFKKALKGFLPPTILFKRKHGMGVPLGAWLRAGGPLNQYAMDRLNLPICEGLFKRPFLDTLWDEHNRGLWDHGHSLWRIVVLTDWLQRFGAVLP